MSNKRVYLCVYLCVCVFLRRVFRHSVCEGGQVLNILIVEPLDLEVQVHVVGALTQSMLLMLCRHKDMKTFTSSSCMMGNVRSRVFDQGL